jgi:hypothetical protein
MQTYYQNDFHFQTDGWFSSKSAKVYEIVTESLFLGCQDAMQRSTLVHIAECVIPARELCTFCPRIVYFLPENSVLSAQELLRSGEDHHAIGTVHEPRVFDLSVTPLPGRLSLA